MFGRASDEPLTGLDKDIWEESILLGDYLPTYSRARAYFVTYLLKLKSHLLLVPLSSEA